MQKPEGLVQQRVLGDGRELVDSSVAKGNIPEN